MIYICIIFHWARVVQLLAAKLSRIMLALSCETAYSMLACALRFVMLTKGTSWQSSLFHFRLVVEIHKYQQ